MGLITKIFGTYSQRELKSIYPIADKIEALADEYKALTDAQLQAKTPEFKERLANGETLDDLLPEAFATVREAADRVLGLRPYRVQLIGGIVLHQGRIAEMKTGEGKTLVATLPSYLNALTGRGVHIVTVNDYLAKRDSEWMDNQEILDARRLFAQKLQQHKEEIAGEAEQVRQAGGLFIVGTERHDSRRIDNQLRGRAGRQGDPGETRFYISLEDDLMRLFGGERINSIMERMNLDEDTPIENKMLTRAIEQAQTTVESRNFQSRKSVLEYDDVMNKQREIIYDQRKQVLEGMDVKGIIMNMMSTAIGHQVSSAFGGESHMDEAGMRELLRQVEGLYFPRYTVRFEPERIPQLTAEEVIDAFTAAAADFYEKKEQEFTSPVMREVERVVLPRVVDEYWMDHIDAMTDLRQGIGLRAYAQTDPIIAYKKESLEMFEGMISAIQEETVRRLYSVRLRKNEEVKRERVAKTTSESVGGDGTVKKQPRKVKKIGRNEPCPCGSGKKYKNCCGRDA